jgi:6-phosphogluconolactonase
MDELTRRRFLKFASAATLATAAAPSFAAAAVSGSRRQIVFVGTATAQGILSYTWDAASGDLSPLGNPATLPDASWITFSADHQFLFAASELDSFNGKPTGEVSSFRVAGSELQPLSAQNSAGTGTIHVALDRTGRVLISADYEGGSAASFLVTGGKLSPAVWTEHYTVHGPDPNQQQSPHAHFVSFSPDNRFAYINDLGGDCIHIYKLNTETAALTPAGTYQTKPGAGARRMHFHPNGHTAYSINELNSTVDVLEWSKTDGSLKLLSRINLLPAGYTGDTHASDTVISKDGKFVYFANGGNNSIYLFHTDEKTGSLTPGGRFDSGGKSPHNLVLDPTDNWMLVANPDSNQLTVFRRNPVSGALAGEGKSVAAATPMCILFA